MNVENKTNYNLKNDLKLTLPIMDSIIEETMNSNILTEKQYMVLNESFHLINDIYNGMEDTNEKINIKKISKSKEELIQLNNSLRDVLKICLGEELLDGVKNVTFFEVICLFDDVICEMR